MMRRLLLQRPGVEGAEVQIVWGVRHAEGLKRYLGDLLWSVRVRPRTPSMKKLMARLNGQRGSKFNQDVAAVFSDPSRYTLCTNVKKLGHVRLSQAGQDLGYIDVLAADKLTHHLWIIECKNLNPARTQYQLCHVLDDLIRHTRGKLSIIHQHKKRVQVQTHLPAILAELGCQWHVSWTVEPLIVTSEPLPSPHLRELSMRILSLKELPAVH